MIYTITFNPAIDYVVQIKQLVFGATNRTISEELQVGGKGINVSIMLHHLGVKSIALGFLAGFTGDAVEQNLAAQGITTDFIRLPEGAIRINVKIKADQETEINGQGPAIGQDALNTLFAKLDKMNADDIFVLAGSVSKNLPEDIYQQVIARLSNRAVKVVVDATGALLQSVLCHRPFLIKPNHLELGEMFGKLLHTDEEVQRCAVQLQQQGARNVLVSMAGEGAMLLDECGKIHRVHAPCGTVKNSVGAGDAMVAGFLAEFSQSENFAKALNMGIAAGSATAFSHTIATREEVLQVQSRME